MGSPALGRFTRPRLYSGHPVDRRAVVPSSALAVSAVALAFGLLTGAAPTEAGDSVVFFGGRLRLGGEVSGTIAPEDEGYFNYTSYQDSSLRLWRFGLAVEVQLAPGTALLAELRSDNLSTPRLYAAYLRLRPWSHRNLDVQAGLVPPVFGAYPRRRYAYDNPLPSQPLAYQYLTALRADAVPHGAEELVGQRGRGWLVRYASAGEPAPGVPLVSGDRWDTGVQLRLGREPLALHLAVTQGSPSRPRVADDNRGKQLSGRLAWRPSPALSLGVSGARADFLSQDATRALPDARSSWQEALGVDLELSRGHGIVRGELVFCRYRIPTVGETRIEAPLGAWGAFAEVRYKLRPGFSLAARLDHLTFSTLHTSLGRRSWDAPVTRVEVGAGYAIRRQVLLKASWQHNSRDGGRVSSNDLAVGQVSLWF